MKKILVVLFSCLFTSVYSQSEYAINDLSPLFYAKVAMNQEGSGTVTIFRKKDNLQLLKVEGDQLNFSDQGTKKIVPYKDQTIVVYDDFNFDGNKDIAIQEMFSTKGPAYVIFLFSNNTFQKNEEFTNIIQESQGSYTLDPATRTIQISSSGGCCFHSSATYVVNDGKPVVTNEASEEVSTIFTTNTTREWKDGKKKEVVDKTLTIEEDPILSFELAGKKKKVQLFNVNDRKLYYILVKENEKVEFNYPVNEMDEKATFKLSPSRNELSFRNGTAEYKIYQKVNGTRIEAVGILVKTGGKEYDLKGDLATLKGSLKDVTESDNLVK